MEREPKDEAEFELEEDEFKGEQWEEEDKSELEVSNEIRATGIDHVINHGLTMREARQSVQPNLSRFTVSGII